MTFDLSNEKLNNLLRQLDWREDTPIVALNDSGDVVLFNSGAEQLLGFNPEEMVGKHVSDLLLGIDKREVNNLFFPETGNRPSGEFSFKTKRDESQDINWNVLYTDGQDGQSELAICLGDPQSEEEIGEQSTPNCTPVRETVLKYKTLFQYAYDAMVLSRFETGRIIEVNPEAENLLGYRTEELLRKRLPDLLADGDFSRLKEKLTEDKFFYQADQPLQKKDGSRIITSTSSSLFEFHEEKTILSLFQDMTEREILENELRSKAKSLRKSNERLEDIIRIISHDLKEPLRSIGTYSDMIFSKFRDKLTGSSFRRLENLKREATRLTKMLDEVSNLARVTGDASPEPIHVPEMVDEVKEELGVDLDDAEITVGSDFPEVEFDKFQLKVLLRNLIANGLKYNEAPKRVEVGYNLEPEETKVKIFVQDNGKGIADEHQKRVFRMFEQLEPDKYSNGTGAGLTLCKRVVEGNGEEIWLDSEPGVGTTIGFTVTVPEPARDLEDFIGQLSSSLELLTDSQKSRSGVIDEEFGLYNRNYFDKVLADLLRDYCNGGNEVRFLVIALPVGQKMKDKYEKDQLTKLRTELSKQIKDSVRQSDLIMRVSENLFLLIFIEMSSEVETVKDRIKDKIRERNDRLELIDDIIEPSFGTSHLTPDGHCDPVRALKEARKNLDK